MPRGNRGIVLPHARRVCRPAIRRDIRPNSNHGVALLPGSDRALCTHDEHSQNGLAAFRSIVRAGLRAGSGPFAPDLDHLTRQSRRLLLGNRRLSRYVARQSERPQPRGLFTRGQTVCLVFGRCFLTVQQPLLLLLENRFGSIACLMSVQRRYSCSGESTPQDRPSWGTGCRSWGTGCRLPICRCGLG
jgi:hypothetical protein